ncbi:MAG: pre-peptidase [Planctomycetes bacterium]|nr:pre-peptidase [Planctomycetota bacterium]
MRVPSPRPVTLSLLSLCLLCGLRGESLAAPPTLTSLHPAGAQRATTVDVTPTGALDANTKVWAGGTGVTVDVVNGKLKVAVAKDAVPGTYWVRAHNAEGASAARPFIVGTLPDLAEVEPNDDYKKAQFVERACVVNGKLEKAGDVDCFAVALKAGQTLVASVEAHHTLRSPMDAMLQIVSADGFVLDENHDWCGLDPQIAFTAKKDGTYIARVFALPAQPDSSVRHFGSDLCTYRLTLTTGAFADFALPPLVSTDKPVTELRGWNLTPAVQKALAFARVEGEDLMTVHAEDIANVVRVRTDPRFCTFGTIEKPRGEARLALTTTKGRPVTLVAESRTHGLAANPVVRVLDADKKELARAVPGKLNGDTTLTFTPPADGPYRAVVTDLYGGGGPRHVFLLRTLWEPDYELTVTADRFTVAPGKPAQIVVKVLRLRGLNKPVELVAEGLPAGVKAEVVQLAKPDPNAVTLSLTADRPASGAFRLVGKVKDDPKLTRTARYLMADFEATTPDLWVTSHGK